MTHVLYRTDTTAIAHKRDGSSHIYKTEGAAKAALTRLTKQSGADGIEMAEMEYYRKNIEKQVVVKNLMTGKDVTQSVNTPLSCDVSSETYWSM